MDLPDPQVGSVLYLGIDDFAFRRGRTFGTVLVNLESHRVIDLLPDRQAQTAAAWMRTQPELTVVSRDRGAEYAAAVAQGAPQALEVADRFHITKNLTEAVQLCLARLLTDMKGANQPAETASDQEVVPLIPVEQWRPAQDEDVKHAIAIRRAEHQGRYQQIVTLRAQGLRSQEIAARLGMKERTVRHWLQRGTFPGERPRRKYQSDFDPYAPYVLQRWAQGEHSGMQIWREIAALGYKGSHRMVYRYLETLKTTEIVPSAGRHRLPHYSSQTAVWLFIREKNDLEEIEQEDLAAFRLASPLLNTLYLLVEDFLQLLRHREGHRLAAWLQQVEHSGLPELQSFAAGIERDKAAVQAGLTWQINNAMVEGHVTKLKLIKRQGYGKAGFLLLRKRVLHAF